MRQVYEATVLPSAKTVVPDLRLSYIRDLVQFPFPRLDRITYDDIASVRRNSDALDGWHRDITAALVVASAVVPGERWSDGARAVMTERLTSTAENLRRSFNRSKWAGAAESGFFTFSLSALGTGASGLLGDHPVPALAASAVSASASSLVSYARGLRERNSIGALLAHYAVFLDE
jgi:hypothetical protein